MDPITDVAIPVLTVFVMWIVGLGLSPRDFARVARPPAKLALATASQIVLLPLIAFAVVVWLEPPIHRTVGLIVIAGCPGGAFSNFFTALARGETALSVALTTTCTLVAVVTLPLVTTAGFALFVADSAPVVKPPVLLMIGQLGMLLVLPMLAGMAVRRRYGAGALRLHRRLQRAGLAGILALIVWILVAHAPDVAAELVPGALTAGVFLMPAMVGGEIVGRLFRLPPAERRAFVVELGFRNLGLAVVVAVTLLGQPDFLAFATVFFVTAVACALAAVAVLRLGGGAR